MTATPVGIGFDIDHTLVVDNKLERVALLHLLGVVLNEGGRVLGSLPQEIAAIDALLARQRAGACTIEEAVAEFVGCHGAPPRPEHTAYFRSAALRMVDDFVVPLPWAARTLASLHDRGIRLGVLSNGWNPLQQRKAARAGFHGEVIASTDIGAQKPARRAFEALLEALGTAPEQTWFVGDDPCNDVAGAAAAGLVPVWLDFDGRGPQEQPAPACLRIERLSDLTALMRDAVPS